MTKTIKIDMTKTDSKTVKNLVDKNNINVLGLKFADKTEYSMTVDGSKQDIKSFTDALAAL